ncbi:MAG: signal peptidase II [bacterium]|nr:signal peptidase II [bacterium]
MNNLARIVLTAIVLVGCVGCDQSTKLIADRVLSEAGPLTFFGDVVRFEFVRNPGAFLGLGANLPEMLRTGLFIWGSCILLLVALGFVISGNQMTRPQIVGMALIVSGGFGNLVDRVLYGTVRDFVSVGLGSVRTGIFNVADLTITIGAIVLLWSVCKPRVRWGRRRRSTG